MNTPVNVLILAAGLGTRMKSDQAKVLHRLGSRPLISHVLRTAAELNPENIIVVVGHQADKVEAAARSSFADPAMAERLQFVTQDNNLALGTLSNAQPKSSRKREACWWCFTETRQPSKLRPCKS